MPPGSDQFEELTRGPLPVKRPFNKTNLKF